MTKQLTAAQRAKLAADERRFKSAVVRFACGVYGDALRAGVEGDAMAALHEALDDVGAVGPETLRNLAWDVEDCVKAKAAARGLA